MREFQLLQIHSNVKYGQLFNFSHSRGCVWYCPLVQICIFLWWLMILDIFHVLLGHSYIFFDKMSLQIFCPFFVGLFAFLLLNCKVSFYILGSSVFFNIFCKCFLRLRLVFLIQNWCLLKNRKLLFYWRFLFEWIQNIDFDQFFMDNVFYVLHKKSVLTSGSWIFSRFL